MNAWKQVVRNLPVVSSIYPHLSRLKKDTVMRLRFRTLRGDRVILPETGRSLYINPKEARGRAIFRCGANGQSDLRRFWRYALETYKPQFAVDVGANYGECVFSGNYGSVERVIAVEANIELKPWIERSHKDHADHDRIELIFALAASESQKDRTLYVDKTWSGTSSAMGNHAEHQLEEVSVDSVCLDDVLESSDLDGKTLLFKLDVEGYEEKVILGLRKALALVGKSIGFIEFNNDFIDATGSSASDFLKYLNQHFEVLVPHPHGLKPLDLGQVTLENLQGYFGESFETNLMLFSDTAARDAFPFDT